MIAEIVLDDDGMNPLSSDALRRLRERLHVASCELRAEGPRNSQPATRNSCCFAFAAPQAGT